MVPSAPPRPCLLQLKEITNTLELVQGQRNELRQEVKDLKAALSDAKEALEVSRQQGSSGLGVVSSVLHARCVGGTFT